MQSVTEFGVYLRSVRGIEIACVRSRCMRATDAYRDTVCRQNAARGGRDEALQTGAPESCKNYYDSLYEYLNTIGQREERLLFSVRLIASIHVLLHRRAVTAATVTRP